MFKYLSDRLFLACVALYALNRWGVKPSLAEGEVFFRGHFNDLLVIPCALPPVLLLHRLLGLRRTDRPPDAYEVALHLAVWSVFFEVLAPLAVRSARADAWDVVAYCAGGLAAWAAWNRSELKSRFAAAPSGLTVFSTPNARRRLNPDDKTESVILHGPRPPHELRRQRPEEEVLRARAPFPV